jgi:hypothetical protein
MAWSIDRSEIVETSTASARDVVQSQLVWVTRGEEVRRITFELKRQAAMAGRTLDPDDLAPFLDADEPPLRVVVTSEGVTPIPPPQ